MNNKNQKFRLYRALGFSNSRDPLWIDLRSRMGVDIDGRPDEFTLSIINKAVINHFNKSLCEGFTEEESKLFSMSKGKPFINFNINMKGFSFSISSLIWQATRKEKPRYRVFYKDCNPLNNDPSNLIDVVPEEVKNKISEFNTGNTYCLGRTYTKETIDKISLNRKGKALGNTNILGYKHTKESKAKMSESHKGRTHSKETRDKMSRTRKGMAITEKARASIIKAQKMRRKFNRLLEHQICYG